MARPSSYKPEYIEKVAGLAREGKTEQEIADAIGVSRTTLKKWKKDFPEFLAALKREKDNHDAEVELSLSKRAKGFVAPDGKYYPPDVTACIFWLKNRQPARWRDKQDVEHSGDVNITVSSKDAEL